MIGVPTAIAQRPHRVTFENPGAAVSDGRGGFTEGTATLLGEAWVQIQPAVGADAERIAPGTVLSHASYIVTGPYLPGITTLTRMRFNERVFSVMGVSNRLERNVELVLVCDELVP